MLLSAKEVTIALTFMVVLWSCTWTQSDAAVYNRLSPSRTKRQLSCPNGTYKHDGRCCKYCSPGDQVKQHCTESAETQCVSCSDGSYSSQPNGRTHCRACTTCTQPNAGLEEKEACTNVQDAVCKCREDHYCPTGHTCLVCHTCTDCGGPENIKVPCSPTNDTVCGDPLPQGGVNVAAAVIVPIVVLSFIALLVYLVYRRKQQIKKKGSYQPTGPDPEGTEMTEMIDRQTDDMQLIKGVDLSRHLQSISKEVGWKTMRELALDTGLTVADIEAHEYNHPNDAVERTYQLLIDWVERQGSQASETLVQRLRELNYKGKAEKVVEIIRKKEQPANGVD